MAGRRPDFNVSFVMRGDDNNKGTIGVAWKSDNYETDGRISLKLNPMVHVQAHPDLFITLFPIEYDNAGNRVMNNRGSGGGRGGRGGGGSRRDDDDEIPF